MTDSEAALRAQLERLPKYWATMSDSPAGGAEQFVRVADLTALLAVPRIEVEKGEKTLTHVDAKADSNGSRTGRNFKLIPTAWGMSGDEHDLSRTGKHLPEMCRYCLIVQIHELLAHVRNAVEHAEEADAAFRALSPAAREAQAPVSVSLASERKSETQSSVAAQGAMAAASRAETELERLRQAISREGLTGEALVALAESHRSDSELMDEADGDPRLAARMRATAAASSPSDGHPQDAGPYDTNLNEDR